jgi:hypothetical protein
MATDKTSKPSKSNANANAPAPDDGEAPEKQDRSIKARKSSLFETHEAVENTQPFSEYVKTAPAAPLSLGVKATLVAIAVLVVALLLAAIFSAGNRGARRRRADASESRPAMAMRLACRHGSSSWSIRRVGIAHHPGSNAGGRCPSYEDLGIPAGTALTHSMARRG